MSANRLNYGVKGNIHDPKGQYGNRQPLEATRQKNWFVHVKSSISTNIVTVLENA